MENLTVEEIIKLWGYEKYSPLDERIGGWDIYLFVCLFIYLLKISTI